jgi:twitching motility protein PilT
VLITGITGAGKSTTIASLIDRIAQNRPCRIVTLEDPIEYRLKSKAGLISQREVGRDVPSFERGLRDCLREDPDVIFVGEMRDRESTSWTLTAAETGHLVFSTLHTRDTRGTISRIIDLYPPNRQDEYRASFRSASATSSRRSSSGARTARGASWRWRSSTTATPCRT